LSRSESRLKLLLGTVGAGLALILLLGLGFWQLSRLEWKTALIETARERLTETPQPWPADVTDPEALNYVRVEVEFTPRTTRLMFQPGGSPSGRAGLRVLVASDVEGALVPVLVDIGWIPLDMKDSSILLPDGPLVAQGVLRAPLEPNLLTPDNDPERRTWYWLDLPEMAKSLDLVSLAPVVIRAERVRTPDGVPVFADYPLQGPTLLEIPNDHLNYAITWFALALVLVAVYLLVVLRHRRERREDGQT